MPVLIFYLMINSVFSMVMIQIPSEVVVNKASAILYGKVVDKTSQKEDGGIIFTYYTFSILENGNIKGSNIPDTVVIKTIGGKVGKEVLDVSGFPVLQKGSEYVLFLEQRDKDNYDIYGANQGCMKVYTQKRPQKVVRPCEKVYFNAVYLEQVGIDSAPKKAVRLEDFIKKVKGYQK